MIKYDYQGSAVFLYVTRGIVHNMLNVYESDFSRGLRCDVRVLQSVVAHSTGTRSLFNRVGKNPGFYIKPMGFWVFGKNPGFYIKPMGFWVFGKNLGFFFFLFFFLYLDF